MTIKPQEFRDALNDFPEPLMKGMYHDGDAYQFMNMWGDTIRQALTMAANIQKDK